MAAVAVVALCCWFQTSAVFHPSDYPCTTFMSESQMDIVFSGAETVQLIRHHRLYILRWLLVIRGQRLSVLLYRQLLRSTVFDAGAGGQAVSLPVAGILPIVAATLGAGVDPDGLPGRNHLSAWCINITVGTWKEKGNRDECDCRWTHTTNINKTTKQNRCVVGKLPWLTVMKLQLLCTLFHMFSFFILKCFCFVLFSHTLLAFRAAFPRLVDRIDTRWWGTICN